MNVERLNYSVVICALARDCGASLSANIPRIEALRKFFRQSAVVVVENDSVDDTKSLLKQWKGESAGVTIISQDFHTVTIPPAGDSDIFPGTSLHRIEKMAAYRNIYLDWIDQHPEKFDLVLVIDIDIRSFSVGDVLRSIHGAPENWGGLFANGYTDTKILGKQIYTMFHDMYAYAEFIPVNKPYFTNRQMFRSMKGMNKKLSQNMYLPVASSFGGIGIYKYEAIVGSRYKAEENGDRYMEAVCEHVSFNTGVSKSGYGAYISRTLKLYYGKSDFLMVIRNLVPLWLFKALCLLIRFRKLKE